MKAGPFGLEMGMSKDLFGGELEEVTPCVFGTTQVPKPHSLFRLYALRRAPTQGLSWIKAIGNNIDTSLYGEDLRLQFDSLLNKLSTAYGKHDLLDFLRVGSIWNEPRDWMQALDAKERTLCAIWNKESGANLGSSLASVYLGANAADSTTGFLTVEYLFENDEQASAEIAALEDDAL